MLSLHNMKIFKVSMTRRNKITQRNARIGSESILVLHCVVTSANSKVTEYYIDLCTILRTGPKNELSFIRPPHYIHVILLKYLFYFSDCHSSDVSSIFDMSSTTRTPNSAYIHYSLTYRTRYCVYVIGYLSDLWLYKIYTLLILLNPHRDCILCENKVQRISMTYWKLCVNSPLLVFQPPYSAAGLPLLVSQQEHFLCTLQH